MRAPHSPPLTRSTGYSKLLCSRCARQVSGRNVDRFTESALVKFRSYVCILMFLSNGKPQDMIDIIDMEGKRDPSKTQELKVRIRGHGRVSLTLYYVL